MDIWSFAIQNLDAEKTAEKKEDFLKLYERGASPKEAAYAAGVAYRQIIIWQFEDTRFREQVEAIAAYRRSYPELAKAIFLDHLAEWRDEYGAAEAGGLTLAEFKALRKADPVFRKAWKEALKAAVSRVKANLFDLAQHGANPLPIFNVLNTYEPETFKPEVAKEHRLPNVEVRIIVGPDPAQSPRRLPAQTGEEIVIDADDQ